MSLWLARVRLDLRRPEVGKDLRNVADLHRRVMKLFPDGIGEQARRQAGVLFRLDDTPTGPQLLVQARMEPNPARLPEGYGTFELRKLRPLLDAISPGLTVHYRLAGNASKRAAKDTDKYRKGQIIPLNGAEADHWWARRAQAAGLTVVAGHSQALDSLSGESRVGQRVRHAVTRFDGVAVVSDADAVRRAVVDGIGKGKAYGCGLLSLAPVREA
jgi:CRISPR system Cascade subunit CasE